MYASTQYARRRGLGSGTAVGAGVGTAVLGPGAGTLVGSLVGSLFGGAERLKSGVKQSVYNDEIGDSRMQDAIRSGTLAQYIATVMLAPAGTPWGTAYSPEAIAWARARLQAMAAGSQAQGLSLAQQVISAAQGAAADLLPGVVPQPAGPAGTAASPLVKAGVGSMLPLALGIAVAVYFFTKPKGRR